MNNHPRMRSSVVERELNYHQKNWGSVMQHLAFPVTYHEFGQELWKVLKNTCSERPSLFSTTQAETEYYCGWGGKVTLYFIGSALQTIDKLVGRGAWKEGERNRYGKYNLKFPTSILPYSTMCGRREMKGKRMCWQVVFIMWDSLCLPYPHGGSFSWP